MWGDVYIIVCSPHLFQVPMFGNLAAAVILQFLVDVLKAGWDSFARRHREAQSNSLASVVVRILTDDDHPDLIYGACVESPARTLLFTCV